MYINIYIYICVCSASAAEKDGRNEGEARTRTAGSMHSVGSVSHASRTSCRPSLAVSSSKVLDVYCMVRLVPFTWIGEPPCTSFPSTPDSDSTSFSLLLFLALSLGLACSRRTLLSDGSSDRASPAGLRVF